MMGNDSLRSNKNVVTNVFLVFASCTCTLARSDFLSAVCQASFSRPQLLPGRARGHYDEKGRSGERGGSRSRDMTRALL
jgi:hypothetical protein